MEKTLRRYLDDSYCFEMDARVLAVHENAAAFDRTCFYPGGGGQPPDQGYFRLGEDRSYQVISLLEDSDEVLWHVTSDPLPEVLPGRTVRLMLDKERRLAFMRYHTALHILNSIALRDYQAWITGVQIGMDRSRIDFKLDNFSPAVCMDLEEKVNLIISEDHPVTSFTISDEEFHKRDDLIRTLDVKPPVLHGRVRVVKIVDFDAQACGGTHVHSTGETGRFSIARIENKGRNNKRFYIHLDPTE